MKMSFNRPVLCSWRRCHRVILEGEQRFSLTVVEGHRYVVALCQQHFDAIDLGSRIRFWWQRHHEPTVQGRHVGPHRIYASYTLDTNEITVTEHFAHDDAARMVYSLTHEWLHVWLTRKFGLMTSTALDVFYKQPLKVLGGHSLHTWALNALYEQTEALNTAGGL